MASLIPGYEYDIFISYRQKDNKGDRWVSEFVDALNDELESTFKEEISVYFDINPHDGLLETHDVDESLKEKLKCLICIPIISRTYCDPKSFAWEHEFKAFVEQASKDQFGLKVKLTGGNVASRVLPVRIHDLDDEDIELCESVVGNFLRGIEFIYKSAGVNRPLRAKEEKPHENLNNTIYRDQINKVANAINEIVRTLIKIKAGDSGEIEIAGKPSSGAKKQKEEGNGKGKVNKTEKDKISALNSFLCKRSLCKCIAIFLAAIIILVLWYLWPFIFKPRIIAQNFESSVAVLSFDDISESEGYENFATGATNDFITRLTRIQNLKVIPVYETLKYAQLKNATRAICRDNDVTMILQGSTKVQGGSITMKVELIDGEKETVLWKQSMGDRIENILEIQNEIITEVVGAINTKYASSQVQKQVGIRPTRNFKAYELFLKGNAELTKWTYENLLESLKYYDMAISIDPDFVEAYANSALASLLVAYFYQQDLNTILEIKRDARKALSLYGRNEIALMSMEGYYMMKMSSGNKLRLLEYRDMITKLKRLILINPSSPMSLFGLAEYYRLYKKDLYMASEYFTLTLDQCERILQSNPSNGIILGISAQSAGLLGQINYRTGNFLEAIKKTEYSIKLVPGIWRTYTQLANFYFSTGQPIKAREVMDRALNNVNNPNDRGFIGLVQGRYSMVEGQYQAAEKYWAGAMNDLNDPRVPYYDYALLYRFVMLKKLGNHGAADSLIRKRLENRGINSWPEPIMYHFSGSFNEEDLINLAKRDWQKCEVFFFLGEKYLLDGNLSEAKRYFENAIGTNAADYLEYKMSEAELGRAFQPTE